MPRLLTRADILDLEDYGRERRAHRRRVADLKRLRRVEVGPFVSFTFENFDTMWLQVHEMLYIERGGEAQIRDELAAYNPLVPQGDELTATVMIEIDEPRRRARELARLGGIEAKMSLAFAGETLAGIPDPTRENTSPEGKASAVQFLHFPFAPAQKAKFCTPATQVVVAIAHPDYGHMAIMPEPVRAALAEDLA